MAFTKDNCLLALAAVAFADCSAKGSPGYFPLQHDPFPRKSLSRCIQFVLLCILASEAQRGALMMWCSGEHIHITSIAVWQIGGRAQKSIRLSTRNWELAFGAWRGGYEIKGKKAP